MNLNDVRGLSALREEMFQADLRPVKQVMNWVSQQIVYGWQPELVRHDGTVEDILRLTLDGKKFVCGTYQRLMFELVTRLGFTAREVTVIRHNTEVGDSTNPWAWFSRHQVLEVDLASRANRLPGGHTPHWALFDPTNNLTYWNSRGALLTVARVLEERDDPHSKVMAEYGPYRRTEVPAGPAYSYDFGKGQFEIVLEQPAIDNIFQRLNAEDHLTYYGYALWRNPNGPEALAYDPTGRKPTQHWNAPLEVFAGQSVRWVDDPAELYT